MQKAWILESLDDLCFLNEEIKLALELCLAGMRFCEFDKHCWLLRHPLIGEKWFFNVVLPGMDLLHGLLSCGNDIR